MSKQSLKTRIIPVLQWDGIQAVKTKQFQRPARPVGSMMQHIEVLERRNIDELIILDINATLEEREPLYEEIKEYTSKLYCPVTIGGGISKLKHIEKLLKVGADKVAIGHNILNASLIPQAIEKFGSQCITGIINHNYFGYMKCHKGCPHSSERVVQYLTQNWPLGELIIQSITCDGIINSGYDTGGIRVLSKLTNIPVIALGGCGKPEHMLEVLRSGASAVAASSMFLFTDITPKDCAIYLKEHGVATRDDKCLKT